MREHLEVEQMRDLLGILEDKIREVKEAQSIQNNQGLLRLVRF